MSRASMDGRLQRLRREATADPREKIRAMAQAGEPLVGEPYAGLALAALARALDTATPRSSQAWAAATCEALWGMGVPHAAERWGRSSLAGYLIAGLLLVTLKEHEGCLTCKGLPAWAEVMQGVVRVSHPPVACRSCERDSLWAMREFARRVNTLCEQAAEPDELLDCQGRSVDLHLGCMEREGHEGECVLG